MKKRISILLVLAMVLSMIPMMAFAASNSTVNTVPTLTPGPTTTTTIRLTVAERPEAVNDFGPNQTFEIVLPAGTQLNGSTVAEQVYYINGASNNVTPLPTITQHGDNVLSVTLNAGRNGSQDYVTLNIPVIVRHGSGDLQLEVKGLDSTVTSQNVTFARAVTGSSKASIHQTRTFERTTTLSTIRIEENAAGTLKDGQVLTLTLPPQFRWEQTNSSYGTVTGSGGLSNISGTPTINTADDRELRITIAGANSTTRGSMFIAGLAIRADRDARYGDVAVTISGAGTTREDLVVATYSEHGGKVEVDGVRTVIAGYVDSGNRTNSISIWETTPGTFIPGREIEVQLPEWVYIQAVTMRASDASSIRYTGNQANEGQLINLNRDRNAVYFTIPPTAQLNATENNRLEFRLQLVPLGSKSGEVEAVIKGAGVEQSKLVVANVVSPVTVTSEATDLRVGVQGQSIKNFKITETAGERIGRGNLTVELTEGVTFNGTPTVKLLSGDGRIGTPLVSGAVLTIPVTSTSKNTPLEIEVSNVKVTLTRSVPEGVINANVRGTSVLRDLVTITNNLNQEVDVSVWADQDALRRVAQFKIGDVVTPAPGEVKATAKFVIGQQSYTTITNGVEVTKGMDVAAFINADGRTMLPVRFVAEALGVSENNIIWNEQARTVTILKGDRVAQMTIGSNIITVNGVQIPMDTTAQIVQGRTVLPLRFAAQALGAEVLWDAATQTVTVNQ